MPAPFNNFQFLLTTYSGREIGVAQYKPYTFGADLPNISVSEHGSMLPSIKEASNVIINPSSSGNQSASISEIGKITFSQTGSQFGNPGDIQQIIIGQTGIVDGVMSDPSKYTSRYTGIVTSPLADAFSPFGIERITGLFTRPINESGFLKIGVGLGNLVGSRKDTASMTFVFFTGSYSSGAFTPPFVSTNYPVTGVDSYSMSFVMFSGSYQG